MKPLFLFIRNHKLLTFFVGVVMAIIFFKGSIYRTCFSYKLIAPRRAISFAKHEYPSKEDLNTREIAESVLEQTAAALSFTTDRCETNPKALYEGSETNCIGYAAWCAQSCNSQISMHCDNRFFKAESYRAQIYFFGFNIHRLFSSPFWKDHDVVVISSKNSSEKIIVDPALYDYFGIGFVTENKK
jgi:hypothetical protein